MADKDCKRCKGEGMYLAQNPEGDYYWRNCDCEIKEVEE